MLRRHLRWLRRVALAALAALLVLGAALRLRLLLAAPAAPPHTLLQRPVPESPVAAPPVRPLRPPPPTLGPRHPIYLITPTYRRPEQLPEMTRMAQTLMHVPALHWLVIEVEPSLTPVVGDLLHRTGLSYDHLIAPVPYLYKILTSDKSRGAAQRNRGLQWLRANATTGDFYFADDDNTYDIQLFEEIRSVKKVGMWPVGLVTKYGFSTPVVVDGKLTGFYDGWEAGRKFPVDMAGFAVSVEFLLQRPYASMPYILGYAEDGFLKSLVPFEPHEIELKANNCTKMLVWHTQTKKHEPSAPLDMEKYGNTNVAIIKTIVV